MTRADAAFARKGELRFYETAMGASNHLRRQSQAGQDPILKHLVPLMIALLLVSMGATRAIDLWQQRLAAQEVGQLKLQQTAEALQSQSLATLPLPPGITVMRDDGTIVATATYSTIPSKDIIAKNMDAWLLADAADRFWSSGAIPRNDLTNDHQFVAVMDQSVSFASWRQRLALELFMLMGSGFIILLLGYAYVWESRRAEQAQLDHETTLSRLSLALENGRCGLWEWSVDSKQVRWSPSMYDLVGLDWKQGPLCEQDVASLIHPDDASWESLMDAAADNGQNVISQDVRIQHKDGGWRWMQVRGERVLDRRGNVKLVGIAMDVTNERQAEAARVQDDKRLREAVESLSEAFVIWDRHDRLVLCNEKYRTLYRLDHVQSLAGMHASEVQAEARPMPDGEPCLFPTCTQTADRSQLIPIAGGRWIQISKRRTRDGSLVAVGTDVTTIKRHETALEKQADVLEHQASELFEMAEKWAREKDRAEEAARVKSQFFANISHELRTPLNAIIGFSNIMESAVFGPLGSGRYLEYCRDIRESGEHLLSLINDVLDMSRIEAGKLSLNLHDMCLEKSVQDTMRVVSTMTKNRKLSLISAITPVRLEADERAIKQIVLNLVSNAIKFTPDQGAVATRVRSVGDHAIITIADNGIGIAKDDLERLGRPFEQVQNQFTKAHKGSGLGLAIAVSLVELHGGRLRIASTPGQGTIVSVRLPLKQPDAFGQNDGPEVQNNATSDQALVDKTKKHHTQNMARAANDASPTHAGTIAIPATRTLH